MSKNKGRTSGKIPAAMRVAILGAIVTIVTTLITVFGPGILETIKNTPVPPSPIPSCISAGSILVTFQITQNNEMIAELAAGETVSLTPDSRVYIKPEIKSVSNSVLPELECEWTNTGIATDGKLLHNIGCNTVDYQSGHAYIKDAIAMQLSQPSCPALAPYPLFIMPKP
jgi:hypothetical protein